ncbi:amidohydrolase [Brevibacterium sp. 5221]|uniref:Amidohydrolase n=1 Tax=Brevibacterium rongguiense TaxID=2695267 RepID=A0A6N9H531_9MICO|nr:MULTISPECIES: M20 family metallopeptidase [Brevibacterium]MYM18896.1 amidohydrolase [Brevibacterium rongguiense]WAL39413.1 M20 family metallopeptidase [Brevibacterium sp. BRM-1]
MASPQLDRLPAEAAALQPDLVALRRALHAAPEVGTHLPGTQRLVLAALEGLGLEIRCGEALTSVVAVLRGARPGPAVLLRGDMDALPVREETGLPFASDNGSMHACGHDLHTAGLIGAARLLAAHREEIAGSVVFMFQPDEEGAGGAEPMLAEGLLDAAGEPPVAAYALHVQPGPAGLFLTRPQTAMAGFVDLEIVMHGKGGHSSQPQLCIDPVPAIAELTLALNTMTTRQFDVFDPVVVSVTQLAAARANNIIPDSASLGACLRYLTPAVVEALDARISRLAHGIAAAHGCTAEVRFAPGFPPTVNDEAETEFALDGLRGLFGADRVRLMAEPEMGSEDFSYVLERVPGCYFYLAATPAGVDPDAEDNHSPRVQFDDAVLGDQAAALAGLALARLARDEDSAPNQ